MKGYVYIDNDRNLNIRTWEYINVVNPAFWQENAHFIDTVWQFDTENQDSMLKLMNSLKRWELPTRVVIDFCKAIKFDLSEFIKKQTDLNASNIQ